MKNKSEINGRITLSIQISIGPLNQYPLWAQTTSSPFPSTIFTRSAPLKRINLFFFLFSPSPSSETSEEEKKIEMLANPSGVLSTPCYAQPSHFTFSGRCKLLSSFTNRPRFLSSKKTSKFCSLSLLLSRDGVRCNRFSVKALAEPEVSESVAAAAGGAGAGGSGLLPPVSVKIPFGDREVSWGNLLFYS